MPVHINDNLISWAPDLEEAALRQAERTSRLPILAGPVALMPDAHFGLGATVGSVVATDNAICPSAVGVDIGCGMIAAETNITESELPDDLSKLGSGRGTRAARDPSRQLCALSGCRRARRRSSTRACERR
jgi:tRNA-splicing ligase RtcB